MQQVHKPQTVVSASFFFFFFLAASEFCCGNKVCSQTIYIHAKQACKLERKKTLRLILYIKPAGTIVFKISSESLELGGRVVKGVSSGVHRLQAPGPQVQFPLLAAVVNQAPTQ